MNIEGKNIPEHLGQKLLGESCGGYLCYQDRMAEYETAEANEARHMHSLDKHVEDTLCYSKGCMKPLDDLS